MSNLFVILAIIIILTGAIISITFFELSAKIGQNLLTLLFFGCVASASYLFGCANWKEFIISAIIFYLLLFMSIGIYSLLKK